MGKIVRLELSDEEIEELDRLVVICGVRTRAELFNFSMAILKWSVRETQKGNEIASIDRENDKFSVMHMPIFDSIRGAATHLPNNTNLQ